MLTDLDQEILESKARMVTDHLIARGIRDKAVIHPSFMPATFVPAPDQDDDNSNDHKFGPRPKGLSIVVFWHIPTCGKAKES